MDNIEPYVHLTIPLDLSFLDLINIIKMYTNYGDAYEWDFYFDYYNMNLLSKHKKEEFDDIKIRQYMATSAYNKCVYGPFEFILHKRNFKKYTKVYPIADEADGIFPTEEEFIKKIPTKDKKYTKDDLTEFNEKLKEIFRKKYKISDEIDDWGYGSNKLVRI
jgi:hypothetical protein